MSAASVAQRRPRRIVTLVEGHGEVEALPVLLWRLQALYAPDTWLDLPRPYRAGRDILLAKHGFTGILDDALAGRAKVDGLLILLDSDDDCPVALAQQLDERIVSARPELGHAVVLAHREFEAWFLASAPSLRNLQGLAPDLEMPPNPESIRGCKEWLTKRRPYGQPYKPKDDQPGLAAAFDIELARANSPSFDKFCRDVHYLMTGKRGA